MDKTIEALQFALASIKDRVAKQQYEKIQNSFNALSKADADARRKKRQYDILEMAALRIALDRFDSDYAVIKCQCGNIEKLDEYLAEIKCYINKLSYLKNKPLDRRSKM